MKQTLSDYPFTLYIGDRSIQGCRLEGYSYNKPARQYNYRNMFELPRGMDIEQYCNAVYDIPTHGIYFIYFSLTQKMIEELGLQLKSTHQIATSNLKLDNKLASDIKLKRAWILLDNSREGSSAVDFNTERLVEFLGEYADQTILITSDYGVDTAKIIPTYFRNTWERNVAKILYNSNTRDMVKTHISWKLDQKTERQYKCILKNRVLKPHRACICYLVESDPQLKIDVNYSFSSQVAWNANVTDIIRNQLIPITDKTYPLIQQSILPDTKWQDVYDYIYTTKNKLLDGEHVNLQINQAFLYSDSLFITHSQAYFQLVTETYYYRSSLFQSEKMFQPILMLQPFIVCGSPYLIQVMRDLGYDTFDDIINHSYDSELNHDMRMKMIFQELKRLCEISHDEWATIMQNLKSRLLSNLDHLKSVYSRFNNIEVHYQPRRVFP